MLVMGNEEDQRFHLRGSASLPSCGGRSRAMDIRYETSEISE